MTHASSENVDVELVAGGGLEQELGEIGREARDHDLALGVAEAHVVLDDLRAVGGEHQPA